MEQTTAADDKKVLVTGASGGIGKAVALAVAAAGYYVICHYNKNKNKAEDVLAAIKQNGGDGYRYFTDSYYKLFKILSQYATFLFTNIIRFCGA